MVFYHLSCIGHKLWRFMGSFRPKTLASGWLFVEFLLLFFTLQRRATGFAHDARHRTFRTRSRESSFRWTLGLVSNRRPTFGFYLGRPMFFSLRARTTTRAYRWQRPISPTTFWLGGMYPAPFMFASDDDDLAWIYVYSDETIMRSRASMDGLRSTVL
jgi:hypothetical protein